MIIEFKEDWKYALCFLYTTRIEVEKHRISTGF